MFLVETVFLANEKLFSICQIFLAGQTIFLSSGNVFLTNSSFRLVKTDFLSNRKSIFLFRALLKLLKFRCGNSCLWKLIFWLIELIFSHFSDTCSSESYFSSGGNVFLNESSIPHGENAFSVLWKPFHLI